MNLLSESEEYKKTIINKFELIGIHNLDFSGCRSFSSIWRDRFQIFAAGESIVYDAC